MCLALSQMPGYEAPNSTFQTFMVGTVSSHKSRRNKRVVIKGQNWSKNLRVQEFPSKSMCFWSPFRWPPNSVKWDPQEVDRGKTLQAPPGRKLATRCRYEVLLSLGKETMGASSASAQQSDPDFRDLVPTSAFPSSVLIGLAINACVNQDEPHGSNWSLSKMAPPCCPSLNSFFLDLNPSPAH